MGVIKIMKNNLNENFRNRTVCRVEHILNRAGNEVKNQFLITTKDGEFFQSYDTVWLRSKCFLYLNMDRY